MIVSLRLERFKSFESARLELGPLNVIVGTNASGKSNLRDAFRFLHGISLGLKLDDILAGRQNAEIAWERIRGGAAECIFRGAASFRFTVELVRSSQHYVYTIEVGVTEDQAVHVIEETLEEQGQGRLFRATRGAIPHELAIEYHADWNQDDSSNLPLALRDDQPVLSQIPDLGRISGRQRFEVLPVLYALRSMRFFEFSPAAMREPSAAPSSDLGEHGENIAAVLRRICADERRKRSLMSWVSEIMSSEVQDLAFPLDPYGRVYLELKESNGLKTSADAASDGTLRVLALLAALFSPNRPEVLFIEEIEHGIHPTRLHVVTNLLEHWAQHEGVQIVATSHAPLVMAFLSAPVQQHALLTYRGAHGPGTFVQRIVDIPHAREVMESQSLGQLHESGWFETSMNFAASDEAAS